MLLDNLIGTWFLQEWDCTIDGRFHNHPFGKEATGMINYTAGGRMSAILSKLNRAPLTVASLAQASDAEKIQVVDGYVSYAGDWRVEGDQVIHSVDFSLLPNWVGTDLIRTISWTSKYSAADEQPQLILSTALEKTRAGKMVVNRLRWKLQ